MITILLFYIMVTWIFNQTTFLNAFSKYPYLTCQLFRLSFLNCTLFFQLPLFSLFHVFFSSSFLLLSVDCGCFLSVYPVAFFSLFILLLFSLCWSCCFSLSLICWSCCFSLPVDSVAFLSLIIFLTSCFFCYLCSVILQRWFWPKLIIVS